MSRDHVPVPVAVVVPTAPSILLERVIYELASEVPDIVNPEVRLVMLSEFDAPVSSAAARSNPAGDAGAVVSTVMLSGADGAESLPPAFVAIAVIK